MARRLMETGRFAETIEQLGAWGEGRLAGSPTLALIFGTAQARLGRHAEGARWVDTALNLSRERGDRAVEVRALNVRGAIALEGGRIDDAANHFMHALAEAHQESDHSTIGRCCTNLGIIANMRGHYDRAIGSYSLALTAFQQASLPWGVVVTHHNLGITYRDKRELEQALEMASRAMAEAADVGDVALAAQTLAGHAEIRVLAGDGEIGRREIERALETHVGLGDVVGQTEDRRILALAMAALGETEEAEATLRDVIAQANEHKRPLLVATARRDLVVVLFRSGRSGEANDLARTTRAQFSELGCVAEMLKLDGLLHLGN